jgi:hypothetical protein
MELIESNRLMSSNKKSGSSPDVDLFAYPPEAHDTANGTACSHFYDKTCSPGLQAGYDTINLIHLYKNRI